MPPTAKVACNHGFYNSRRYEKYFVHSKNDEIVSLTYHIEPLSEKVIKETQTKTRYS